ncbi:Acetoacetate--CoA ligase OS=Streptomyces alboniger OX=132473 GN=CP975_05020 PE=4 SV=1 [Streptomyces alboniger]
MPGVPRTLTGKRRRGPGQAPPAGRRHPLDKAVQTRGSVDDLDLLRFYEDIARKRSS